MAGLNPAQREAVEHLEGPILVLAGAGSGKTRVLTVRIARLIAEHRVSPQRIFAVTFTNKAASEMRERVARLLSYPPQGLWIGTFHSLSARMLRREAAYLGFTRNFTIYNQDDRLSLIRRIMSERNHSTKLFPPKMIQQLISDAKNAMQTPSDLERSAPGDRAIGTAADVYMALQIALKSADAMDFDDLLLYPLELFRKEPEVLQRWQEKFEHILVDEFQDTNRVQYELIRALGARHRNVFAVGDDDQSIYGWRGADVRNMHSLQSDFGEAKLVKLEQNYRSTRPILDAANAVISHNPNRLGKVLRSQRPGGEQLILLAASDERDEAEWVARELLRRRQDGMLGSEAAVLYRTNAQSRALEDAFRRAGLPYRIVGAISFYERREVKDLLAYLRLIANPRDDEAFLRAIPIPRRGIGDSSLTALAEQARLWGFSLLETAARGNMLADFRPNVRAALSAFAGLIRDLTDRVGESPPAVIMEEICKSIGYRQVLAEEGPEGIERWENVAELIAGAADWSEVVDDEEPGTPLQRFLAEAALLSAVDNNQGVSDGVTLMTLHTAKGLEWPVVVMAGMEDGLFPSSRALESAQGLDEERRLCYVGITRARDQLILTWARSRRRGGQFMPGAPSRFLRELPPGLIEEQRTSFAATSFLGTGRWDRSGTRSALERPSRQRGRDRGDSVEGFGRSLGRVGVRSQAATPSIPDADDAIVSNQDAPRYLKGEKVLHRRFGTGVIAGLSGAGKNLKVTVIFDDPEIGSKQLLVAFAGLERNWESA